MWRRIKEAVIWLLVIVAVAAACVNAWNRRAGTQKEGVEPTQTTAVQADQPSSLRVHYLDVGQGDCVIVESAGHFMVIDAGENEEGLLVIRYLKYLGAKSIDYAVGTHPHSDHIGGMDTVMNAFTTKTILMPDTGYDTKTYENVLEAAGRNSLDVTPPVPGQVYTIGDASFEIIAPVRAYGENLNDWSVGLRLTFGGNHFLFAGDAEGEAEADICSSGREITADVLKVNHHGSFSSTTESYMKAVKPDYAVIQCGKDNVYGYPHTQVIKRLEKYGAKVYRNDLSGTITAESNGTEITWFFEENDTWLQSVPDSLWNYVLNMSSGKYHRLDCPKVNDIVSTNKSFYSGDISGLRSMGYVPCNYCN